ncbi:MAG: Gfo/Idh/MocA family oxidoreductase [Opitutaceae bacterium]|nr:Gfo/Idh/MocA family oxidoreductase [Verrucomicrobiales bacterium]
MKEPVRLGLIGCGYWGPNLIRNFRSLPDCRMKVMCDLNPQRLKHLKGLYPEVEGSMDWEQLVQSPDLDALAIVTSVRFHFDMAKASLLAGKHTFIEKPMAASSAQCEELVEIAKEKGLVLMVGHTFLYSPVVRRIKQIIQSGDIGTVRYIVARRLNLGLFQNDINVVWDLAPHDLSVILYLMDEMPLTINCNGSAHVTRKIEDVASTCLTFANHRCAMVQNSWLEPRKVREMTIVGTQRMVVYDDVEVQEKIKIYDTRVNTPPHYDSFAEFQYSYHYGDIYTPHVKQEEPLKVECQHFIDCIRNGETPITCGRKGLELVQILEASSQSLREGGGPIRLKSKGKSASADSEHKSESNGSTNGHGKSKAALKPRI